MEIARSKAEIKLVGGPARSVGVKRMGRSISGKWNCSISNDPCE